MLHEITHVLGFGKTIRSNGNSGVTNTNPGVYSLFESWWQVGKDAPASPVFAPSGYYIGNPADLIDNSPGIWFWGQHARAVNNNKPQKVYQSSGVFSASTLAHTSEVMKFSISYGVAARAYSVRNRAILRDLGWRTKSVLPGALGPQKISMLDDSLPGEFRTSFDVNFGLGMTRFHGEMGGLAIEDNPNLPPPVYLEDPTTARGDNDAFTQINRADAPGSIALQNRDGSHSSTGTTWISPWQNLNSAARPDEKFVVPFRANPTPALSGTAPGTYFDAVVGASSRAVAGGAAGSNGIGIRRNATGPYAGMWQIFDGTGARPRIEASGPSRAPSPARLLLLQRLD